AMDQDRARETAERMLRAQFTLDDFLVQMREMRKLGPIEELLAMLPGVRGGPASADRARVRDHDGRRERPAQGVRGREEDDAHDDGRAGRQAPARAPG